MVWHNTEDVIQWENQEIESQKEGPKMNTKKTKIPLRTEMVLLLLVALILSAAFVLGQSSENYRLTTWVLDEGGGQASSSNCRFVISTIGQPTPIGESESNSFDVFSGYIYTLEAKSSCTKGDVDGSGVINVLDVLAAVNHILGSQLLVGDALQRADCNGDGSINVLDALGIVNVILGIIPECPGQGVKVDIYPETIEFLNTLKTYFSPQDFASFMAMVKQVGVPTQFELAQNYPNPFNPYTDIRYQIADSRSPTHTTLKIFNILGQEVATLVDEVKEPGYYTVTWDGRDEKGDEVPSGIYFYRMRAGDFTAIKKMALIK